MAVGLLGKIFFLDQKDAPISKSDLVLALEEINRPFDFCGTPQEQAIHKAKTITGLTRDKVIEMAANHAIEQGMPVYANQEEHILDLNSVELILDSDGNNHLLQ